MRHALYFSIAAVLSMVQPSMAAPMDPVANLEGLYVGCGVNNENGKVPMIFHIIEMPTLSDETKVTYSAAFVWHVNGTGNVHFPEIAFQKSGKRMMMETRIVPRTEYGEIKNSVTVDINADGSLSGIFRANSTNPLTRYLHGGRWKATRRPNGVIPDFDTICR